MFFHYFSANLNPDTIINIWIKYGYLGVNLFFVISGFVIYFSVIKNIKEYFIGRFLRLYPLFWIICTVTYITTWIFEKYNGIGDPLPIYKYFLNLLIISNSKTTNLVDGSYWTLTIEILFYIYIGIFAYMFKAKKIEWFYVLWLTFSVLAFAFNFQETLLAKLALVRYSPYFVFGGTLATLYNNWNTSSHIHKIKSIAILTFASSLPYIISEQLHKHPTPSNLFGVLDDISNAIVGLIFLLIILATYFSKYINNQKIINIAILLGGITYPLYLLHEKLEYMFISLFSEYGKITTSSLVTAGLMIAVSAIIAKYEKSFRKYLKNKIDNYEKR